MDEVKGKGEGKNEGKERCEVEIKGEVGTRHTVDEGMGDGKGEVMGEGKGEVMDETWARAWT